MNANKAKLLIVDDSRSIRQMLQDLMKAVGFVNIDEASDGRRAFDLFLQTPYDLLLVDWNMPLISGLELLRTIRRGSVRPDTQLLLFTAEVTPQRMVEAINEGASGFVAKPFSTTALSHKVLRVVSQVHPVTEFVPPRAGKRREVGSRL